MSCSIEYLYSYISFFIATGVARPLLMLSCGWMIINCLFKRFLEIYLDESLPVNTPVHTYGTCCLTYEYILFLLAVRHMQQTVQDERQHPLISST